MNSREKKNKIQRQAASKVSKYSPVFRVRVNSNCNTMFNNNLNTTFLAYLNNLENMCCGDKRNILHAAQNVPLAQRVKMFIRSFYFIASFE